MFIGKYCGSPVSVYRTIGPLVRQCFMHFLEHDSTGSRELTLFLKNNFLSAYFMKASLIVLTL